MKITTLAAGRRFADAIPDGERFRLRFMDGYEIQVQWDSGGPVATGYAQGIITNDMDLHPQFHYVRGKVVDKVYTDGETLVLSFTDGHELRSSFKGSQPKVLGVDVKVRLGRSVGIDSAVEIGSS